MNLKMILMVVGALLAGAGGSAAFFIMTAPEPTTEEPVMVKSSARPGIVDLEEFMVNINDPSGQRFAKLNLRITVAPASAASDMMDDALMQAKARDRILTLLTSKTLEDLAGPVGKEGLRHEIKAQLDPLIEEGEIQEVLFSDFMLQ